MILILRANHLPGKSRVRAQILAFHFFMHAFSLICFTDHLSALGRNRQQPHPTMLCSGQPLRSRIVNRAIKPTAIRHCLKRSQLLHIFGPFSSLTYVGCRHVHKITSPSTCNTAEQIRCSRNAPKYRWTPVGWQLYKNIFFSNSSSGFIAMKITD